MANDVFANGREICCKKSDGKAICAFPDVCFTPPDKVPPTPMGIPIPYPNTGNAKDLTKGSKKVLITGKEVLLRNVSHFKKSMGDEAGSAAKKGMINSQKGGKVYFSSWSSNVKIEGKNVVRHLDLTTHNHASQIGNEAIPWPYTDSAVVEPTSEVCEEAHENMKDEADTLPDSMSRVHEDAVTRGDVRRIADAYGGRSPPATTIAVGNVVGGGAGSPSSYTAHSRASVGNASGRAHFSTGISDPSASGAEGCATGAPHEYRDDQVDHRHAEAKIIEDWMSNGGGGQLVLSVSRPVCENCAALIRHINCGPEGERCNKVLVCDDNQNDESRENLQC